jgi:hypothetical protein
LTGTRQINGTSTRAINPGEAFSVGFVPRTGSGAAGNPPISQVRLDQRVCAPL